MLESCRSLNAVAWSLLGAWLVALIWLMVWIAQAMHRAGDR